MECDSVHSAIEKAKWALPIYAPMDYYTVIAGARRRQPYVVHPMSQADMNDFSRTRTTKDYISNRSKTTTGETVAWLQMKWIRYRKEASGIIAFRYDYDEPFKEMQNKRRKKRIRGVTAKIHAISCASAVFRTHSHQQCQICRPSVTVCITAYPHWLPFLLHSGTAETVNADSAVECDS